MNFKIIWGDITREKTDALVTLASREAKVGSGVDKSVHAAAGAELLKARLKASDKMGPGIAVFTQAFGLKKTCGAKNVIHIAGVLWEGGGHDESILIDAAYLKAMAIANALGAEVVTLPVMGAGKYGMPKPMALDQAVRSLKECNRYFPDIEIKLVTVEAEIYDYAKSKYAGLCESHFSPEEESKFRKKFPAPRRGHNDEYCVPWLYSENDTEYWKNLKLRKFSEIGDFGATFRKVWGDVSRRDREIENGDDTRILLRGVSALASLSGVSVSTIKHILYDDSKCPSRDVVMALCLALELPLPYFTIMLKKCGYTFTSDMEERIVAACIRDGVREARDLNDVLCKKLGKKARLEIGNGETGHYKVKSGRNAKATMPRCAGEK